MIIDELNYQLSGFMVLGALFHLLYVGYKPSYKWMNHAYSTSDQG